MRIGTEKQWPMDPYISQRKIQLKVEVPPEQVDKNWRSNLFLHVCQKFQGRCTREDGYIVRIQKIERIYDQYIKRTSGVVLFFIGVVAECILPQRGDVIAATVDMIFPHGVFCHHHMLRMMMPITKCKDFHIRQEFSTKSLYNPHTKTIIRKGDTIKVVIEDVRFENDFYSCIVAISA